MANLCAANVSAEPAVRNGEIEPDDLIPTRRTVAPAEQTARDLVARTGRA